MSRKRIEINEEHFIKVINEEPTAARACKRLGMKFTTFKRYAEKLGVYKTNIGKKGVESLLPEDILIKIQKSNKKIRGQRIKQVLFLLGIKEEKCERCGLKFWNGQPLSLELHHKDGNPYNNSLENFEILCPNCHSQTENFRGRISKKEENEMMWIETSNKTKSKSLPKNKTKSKSLPKVSSDKFCKRCGKNLTTKQKSFCSYKCMAEWNAQNVPSKEELIELKEKYKSNVRIGKAKGVSDNAVRKWFKKYNLL